jgi:N utilization substance protein B
MFMALSPQKFREIVLQLLYSYDFFLSEEDDVIDCMMHELSVTKKTMREAKERQEKIFSSLSEIDALIAGSSASYDVERIGRIEKSILRLGVYELCLEKELPPKVVIAEAIRLARKFSTAESGAFFNAILDALWQESLAMQGNCESVAALSIS